MKLTDFQLALIFTALETQNEEGTFIDEDMDNENTALNQMIEDEAKARGYDSGEDLYKKQGDYMDSTLGKWEYS